MDIRELDFWLREAAREEAAEMLLKMSTIRAATCADSEQYHRIVSDLEGTICELAGRRAEEVKENWAFLRSLKRG